MDPNKINEDFLSELIKSCLTSKGVLEIAIKHLQNHYIESETHKKLFERISQTYQLQGSTPTIGSLSQDFIKDDRILGLLLRLKDLSVVDKKDIILSTLEKFLIRVKFIDLHSKTGRLWNEGKQEQAIQLMEKEAPIISNFTIKDTYYATVFRDFDARQHERQMREREQAGANKVPFSIHCLDAISRGGMNRGTSTLVMARSGKGKSTFVKWVAVGAARAGLRVVLFVGEGTEQENLDILDSAWSSVNIADMEFGFISADKVKAIQKANRDIIAGGGEVFVRAAESFDSMTLNDCNDILEDIEKIHGKVDLAIFDSVELFSVAGKYYNSESGERKRREDISNKITSIATSRNLASLATIQANDVKKDVYEKPEFVMTRSEIAEFKGALKPFANFFTLNATSDEETNGISRIHIDKIRKAKTGGTYKVCTSLENGRYYDSKKTLNLFWDDKLNTPRKK